MKTEIFFSLLKKASRFILIALISFTLTLTWAPASMSQFPFPTTSSAEGIPPLPRWDPNKARQCGKFWCSEVNLYGNEKISGELTLGAFIRNPDQPEQPRQETAFNLEQRAKLVQQIFGEIFRGIVKSNPEPQVSEEKPWSFWLFNPRKPLHPLTPDISVGTQNNQTVIFIPTQEELGLIAQTILTVTELDAKVNKIESVPQMAEIWRNQLSQSMSNILWGHELDLRYPWVRPSIVVAIAIMVLISMQIVGFLRRFLRRWNKSVARKLEELTASLTVDPEAVSAEKALKSRWEDIPPKFWLFLLELDCLAAMLFLEKPLEESGTQTVADEPKSESRLEAMVSNLRNLFQLIIMARKRFIPQRLAKLTLENQFLLKQEKNLSNLLMRISMLAFISVILIALGLIVALFRPSRFLINLFFQQVYLLPLVWIGMLLADEIVDFFIDYALVRWAREGQERDPSSNRYTLRATTYSKAFTNGTTILFVALGIILTVWVIGINPAVLAGAGVVALAVGFLSRNLVEDMLNGILILATDRYAVGDVIDVGGGLSGFVEDMNLYTTSLRNLDGQVIAIPNGKIASVINMTKNWSRVNFTLKISWNADLKKALEVMRQVGDQMLSEPKWQELVLEPADILGIDELSHDGILIRMIMKTRPMQQWLVGREYRLRVKQALDKAGISLGVPQREVAVIASHTHSRENNGNELFGEVGEQEKENIESQN